MTVEPEQTTPSPSVEHATARGVATVTLNRPGAANALDLDAKENLLAILERAAGDPEVRAVLLAGTGKAFCVGQDLGEHAQALSRDPDTALETVEQHYNPIVRTIAEMPKPVVVAINGACVGAGLGFALAGDIRVAAESATFGTAFAGIGLASDSGLAANLVHALGSSRATELLMLGTTFTPQQALDWGLVHRVVGDGQALTAATELAERLARGPTSAYAETRGLLRAAATQDFGEMLRLEAGAQQRLARTSDHHAAVRAFLDKRTPEFDGR